jgi:hypothetical protein
VQGERRGGWSRCPEPGQRIDWIDQRDGIGLHRRLARVFVGSPRKEESRILPGAGVELHLVPLPHVLAEERGLVGYAPAEGVGRADESAPHLDFLTIRSASSPITNTWAATKTISKVSPGM